MVRSNQNSACEWRKKVAFCVSVGREAGQYEIMNFLGALPFCIGVLCVVFSVLENPLSAAVADGLVPLPVSVEEVPGKQLVLKKGERGRLRSIDSGDARRATRYLNQAINERYGSDFLRPVVLRTLENSEIINGNPEGYVLEISDKKIKISAQTYGGYFYAIQTLLQLLPDELGGNAEIVLPACKIVDYPRFAWRGFMLDSARHFQSVEWIKKLIDLLASQKINTLHWHLTDDQAWRIEIRKYPELTQRGAWRESIGFNLPPESSIHYDRSGRYGGFYSQEEIREIVRYAAERNITIVPEIELPGHAVAALTVFPDLGCTGGPYSMRLVGGVANDVFCAGNPRTYSFLEDVLAETAALFPGTFFHVGGDECSKIRWRDCPKCQAKIRSENLKNEHELQSFIIRHMEKFLSGKGKRLIGWDEILQGGLAPNATVMSWRGASGGIEAAKLGHDVVMTPNSHCYFDYSQARTGEPRSIGGFVPLERIYGFEPTKGVPEEFHRHILGAQANLWTEYIPNEAHAEYMIAPRISALAEVAWTPSARRNWSNFQDRMLAQYQRFERAKINYRRPDGVLIRAVPAGVSFSPDLKNAPVVYTLDGSDPTLDSARAEAGNYRVKIPVEQGAVRVRARAILTDGKLGRICERLMNLPKAKVVSTLGTTGTNFPERAIDGSRVSVYWSDRLVYAGDTVAATFEKLQQAREIRCVTGKNENGGGGDCLHHGVLEISEDGTVWHEIAVFKDGIAAGTLPAGTTFKALRIRATQRQEEWLVVREFEFSK